jgi:hypothetical protein
MSEKWAWRDSQPCVREIHTRYRRSTCPVTRSTQRKFTVPLLFLELQPAAQMKNRPKAAFAFLQLPDLLVKFGRRDWTRTNDPHHVKVVL